jgi:succinate dehydrogenase / fumarate reductase cytochrome b subunit
MAIQPTASSLSQWTKILLAYKWHSGSWAWILNRITGLGLTAYIFIHIFALTSLTKHAEDGGIAFNEEMKLFQTPVFMVGEWLLFSLVIYHTLNGIRIALVDLANGARYHKPLLVAVFVVGIVLFLAIGYIIFQQPFRHAAEVMTLQ